MKTTIATRLALVSLAAILMTSTAAVAGDLSDAAPAVDVASDTPSDPPREEPKSDDGPLTHPADESGDEPSDPPSGEQEDEPSHGDTAPDTPPTQAPIDIGDAEIPAADSAPTGSASCQYFYWEVGGDPLYGTNLTNTGNTTIKAGSIVHFTLAGGQQVQMVVPMDVVPGGSWAFFVGNYPNPALVFPDGTQLPPSGDCDIQIAFA